MDREPRVYPHPHWYQTVAPYPADQTHVDRIKKNFLVKHVIQRVSPVKHPFMSGYDQFRDDKTLDSKYVETIIDKFGHKKDGNTGKTDYSSLIDPKLEREKNCCPLVSEKRSTHTLYVGDQKEIVERIINGEKCPMDSLGSNNIELTQEWGVKTMKSESTLFFRSHYLKQRDNSYLNLIEDKKEVKGKIIKTYRQPTKNVETLVASFFHRVLPNEDFEERPQENNSKEFNYIWNPHPNRERERNRVMRPVYVQCKKFRIVRGQDPSFHRFIPYHSITSTIYMNYCPEDWKERIRRGHTLRYTNDPRNGGYGPDGKWAIKEYNFSRHDNENIPHDVETEEEANELRRIYRQWRRNQLDKERRKDDNDDYQDGAAGGGGNQPPVDQRKYPSRKAKRAADKARKRGQAGGNAEQENGFYYSVPIGWTDSQQMTYYDLLEKTQFDVEPVDDPFYKGAYKFRFITYREFNNLKREAMPTLYNVTSEELNEMGAMKPEDFLCNIIPSENFESETVASELPSSSRQSAPASPSSPSRPGTSNMPANAQRVSTSPTAATPTRTTTAPTPVTPIRTTNVPSPITPQRQAISPVVATPQRNLLEADAFVTPRRPGPSTSANVQTPGTKRKASSPADSGNARNSDGSEKDVFKRPALKTVRRTLQNPMSPEELLEGVLTVVPYSIGSPCASPNPNSPSRSPHSPSRPR